MNTEATKQRDPIDLIVIGAGPSGLSCAIQAKKAGLSCVVLEKGSLVDYVRRFPQKLIWFSTPELLEIGGLPFPTATVHPTRVDALTYYQKVTQYYELDVRYFDPVKSVVRYDSVFSVSTEKGETYFGRNVVVATGYYDNPNRLDIPGELLPKVSHYYDEPFKYFGCDVAVIGGRNSAVESSLDLFRHGARVTLIHRGNKLSDGVKYWILPDIENRIKSGEIRALFQSSVREIKESSLIVKTPDEERELKNDFVLILIGFHPDTDLLRRFGVEIDPETLAPRHDKKTYETNIPGVYVAGSVVAGKYNNKIFIENGRLHGHAIVSSILSKHQDVQQRLTV